MRTGDSKSSDPGEESRLAVNRELHPLCGRSKRGSSSSPREHKKSLKENFQFLGSFQGRLDDHETRCWNPRNPKGWNVLL